MSTSIAAARSARDLRPDWRDDAACWDADPELFFPDGDVRSARTQVKTAKLICRGCPSHRTEQLPPATQVRVRGSQIEVDRVQP